MINVLVLNGGRGAGSLIPELLENPSFNVTSIVNAYDDGKSTGEIRSFFEMLGPSDIRKVQELMLPMGDIDYKSNLKIFQYRFPVDQDYNNALEIINRFISGNSKVFMDISFQSELIASQLRSYLKEFMSALKIIETVKRHRFNFSDCSIMNCIYAGAFIAHKRNIEVATLSIEKLFNLRGEVIPTSIENKKLAALRENGDMLYSEAEIVELRSNVRIERIYLLDDIIDKDIFDNLSLNDKKKYLDQHHCYVAISSRAKAAIDKADIIIYSAGTQHSSLYPTYLSVGLAQGIADNHKALKVFVTNIGADYETPSYMTSDYIKGAYRYLKLSDQRNYSLEDLFNFNLVNNSQKSPDESYVKFDKDEMDKINVPIVHEAFESDKHRGKHDGKKLLSALLKLYESMNR
tara:strand:- start:14487 stop:15701 length:1215 start_codon:yes stop_codon:yes gene_type:complete